MAFIKCKGTTLKQYIASAYVAVAQVIDLDWSGMKAEAVECDTLDNAVARLATPKPAVAVRASVHETA